MPTDVESLPLPRALEADPRAAAVRAALAALARPLWEQGSLAVARAPLSVPLERALLGALRAGAAAQGLERAEAVLRDEQRGLDARVARGEAAGGARVSRLLVLADDGSRRFYRDAEGLLLRYGGRLLGLRVAAPGDELGRRVLGREALARALLVTDREAVTAALLALANP
jgi:hypothetical protein